MFLQGGRCVSLQWGAWAGAGMAAADASLLSKLSRQGYGAIQPASGLSALRAAVAAIGVSNVVVSSFVWPTFLKGKISFFAGHTSSVLGKGGALSLSK
jgi:hypothetical protein